MGDKSQKIIADELRVEIEKVTTQNIYECSCRAENQFSGAITEMAPDDVSALPVLGGGLLVKAGEAIGYFSNLKLFRGRLARLGFSPDLDESGEERR